MTEPKDETSERTESVVGEAPEAPPSPGSEETPAPEAAADDPVARLEAERNELKDKLLRTAADFDNFRKRARKDVEEAARGGREFVLREILPVIDNLERAVAASETTDRVEAVVEGVKLVLRSFEDTASRIGLERVKTVGERFDPSVHDAIQQVESADAEPGTVIAEALAGYKLGDRLLRAALVVVAKKP